MGVNGGALSKNWVPVVSPERPNSSDVNHGSWRGCGNTSILPESRQEDSAPKESKIGSGVYFQNRQVPNIPLHPLVVSQTLSPSVISQECRMARSVPAGNPLSPAPQLGHFRFMTRKPGSAAKTKVSPVKALVKTKPCLTQQNEYRRAILSPEEKLFLEAAQSLKRSHVPSVDKIDVRWMRNKSKNTLPTHQALPPPPFSFV